MYKRILAFVFVVLFVVLSVPVSAFAEETSTEFKWKDLSQTTVKDDLSELVVANYKENSNILNPYIVSLAEQGFSENQNYDECALYVYIYNPTGEAIKTNGLNKIQMKQGDVNTKYALKYINATGVVSKFRVDLPKSFFEQLDTNKRIYDIVSVELQYVGENEIHDYKIGGTYTFTGKGKDTKLEKVETFEVINLDVHFTTYRIPSEISGSVETMHQLTSVYFSVPNYYEKKYDAEVYGMECVYEKYYTKPYVVVNNEELYGQLKGATSTLLPLVDVEHSNTGKDYYSSSIANGLYRQTVSADFMSFYYHWSYNLPRYGENSTIYNIYGERILPVLMYTEQKFDKDFWISSDEVTKKVYEFYNSALGKNEEYKNAKIGDYYHSLLFEPYWVDEDGNQNRFEHRVSGGADYYSAKQHEKINRDSKEFNIYSYSDTHSFWEKINDIGIKALWKDLKNDFSIDGLSRVERVDKLVSGFEDENVSSMYLVNENEVAEFKNVVKDANNSDSSVFIFRLDVAPYKVAELLTQKVVDNKVVGHAISFQEPVYMGFDVISLEFRDDNGDIISVSVSADPQDLIGGVEAPPTDTMVDKDRWAEIKAMFEKFLKIFALALGVFLIVSLIPYLIKFVQSLIDSTASILQGGTNKSSYKTQRRRRKRK